ncbi:hypothetical protein SAMN05216215_101968 [Saccharopolyspora shandongensis]|uniref:Uncharacterized protein n=1 Tax=Saccharopolyspora shandongensis TaxID=418495 RepID=A0A1H3GUM4_9PSEU|nr:DUF6597 domain-containing transcriptional factor [Saccharopolyspora shandongensis]SDY06039.1 hypothetical protein SAMN05216215_101968 [Saccharopolyspora shandongensis]
MAETQYVKAKPPPHLRPLITDMAGYRIRSAPGVHRGLPSRSLTVILTLDETVDIAPDSGPAQSYTALVGGLHRKPTRITHGELQHGIQLGLTPLGARALLGMPAGELADTGVDLAAMLGAAAPRNSSSGCAPRPPGAIASPSSTTRSPGSRPRPRSPPPSSTGSGGG